MLQKEKEKSSHKKALSDFFGIMTKADGEELKRNIHEGCENIDQDDW